MPVTDANQRLLEQLANAIEVELGCSRWAALACARSVRVVLHQAYEAEQLEALKWASRSDTIVAVHGAIVDRGELTMEQSLLRMVVLLASERARLLKLHVELLARTPYGPVIGVAPASCAHDPDH